MSFLMSKPMGLPLPYFTVCLSLSFGLFTAKGANVTSFKGSKEFAGGILSYASFVPFFNHKLNHSAVVESREVEDEEECIAACTEKDICRSVNFKTTRDENGKYSCQILDTDKFISHNLFVASLDFHHYSLTGPCEHNPCNNGGTCYPCSDQKDFTCKCPPSLQGRTCDEAPYRDCVELLNAGIRNTGVHTIVDKNWEVPVYCDQEYMGGGWTMVFKVPSRNPLNIYNVWTKQESHNVAAVEIIDVASSSRKYYKNRWIKNWEQKKTQEVRLALYENESEVLSLVFNATGNDNENWFSKNRLLRSPWTDLHSELQNFFSLAGDLPNERVFYINKVNGNCTGDVGWLMVSAGKLCDYESRHSSKWAFMYSKLGTRVNWNEYENVGVADVLVVFVR